MTSYDLIMIVPLFGMLLYAATVDILSRRIPNWLSFSMILSGLVGSYMAHSYVSPGDAWLGLLTGFGLAFILFGLNAIGGGDVKLFAGVGAWLGPEMVFWIFIAETVIGLLLVLSMAIWQGRLRVLFRNSAVLAINLAHVGDVGLDHASETGASCKSVNKPLPYAVPILLATVLVVLRTWANGG